MNDSELLKVYSASAGSGKTYTLAQQFIDLLARNPRDYEHILAVTFTKKATAEMKERIIENLALLAYEAKDEASQKKRQSMIDAQLRLFESRGIKLNDNELTKSAKTALLLILNDYGQFNVNTIDSFVQKVIRAFAFEAGLSSQFGIELDEKLVIAQSVDELMLNMQNDKQLREWLINLMRNKLEENESTQIDNDLKNFAADMQKKIGSEDMKFDKVEILQFANEMSEIRTNFEKLVGELGRAFVDSFRNSGGDKNSLERGKNNKLWKFVKPEAINLIDSEIAKMFIAEANNSFFEREDEKIFAIKKDIKIPSYDYYLKFKQLQKFILDNILDYNTAVAICKNIFIVGLLADIRKKIDEIANREKIMPINSSNTLLHSLIDGSSIPFIYEKIGTRFKNIMIDEFQDTSRIQWENFRPLVRNSLDQHNECLIVGDVKQAIYRWRDSDWRLLAESIDADCQGFVNRIDLKTNWRSMSNIINFNNEIIANLSEIFSHAIAQMTNSENVSDPEIDKIYAASAQEIPSSKPENQGYVRMRFANKKGKSNNSDDDEESENEDFMKEVVEAVKMLHDGKNYQYSDICVLTRKKSEVETVISYFSAHGIPAISNDALLICNSQSVSALISHLKYIADQNDRLYLAHIVISKYGNEFEKIAQQWESLLANESSEVLKLKGLGLVEMVDAIIERLPEENVKRDFIFVEAFKEQLRSYIASKHVNLHDFIDFIDEKRDSLAVTVPDDQDAVTLITIHKSKGLQFKAVLMPFADWQILGNSNGMKTELLWVKLDDKFGKISPLPLKFSKSLADTHARANYLKECQMRVIDNLNLIYVAFTRAEQVLMTWSDKISDSQEFTTATTIAPFLRDAAELTGDKIENASYIIDNDQFTFEYGEIPIMKSKSNDTFDTEIIKPCKSAQWSNKIRISKESEKVRREKQNEIIAKGNMMHSIMEYIKTVDDVSRAVKIAQLEGQLDEENSAKIEHDIIEHITSDAVVSWFDDSQMRVLTETDFMTKDGDSRPDRIMIDNQGVAMVVDYKFGELHIPRYEEQVLRYMSLLESVGFEKVEGFLWYYYENRVVKVEKPVV